MAATAQPTPPGKSRVTAAGCAGCLGIVMAVPFLALAYSVGRQAMAPVARGAAGPDVRMLGFAVLLALTVLFTVVVPTMRARRQLTDLDARKGVAPDRPWLWRADWASRRIAGSYTQGKARGWVVAVIWNAMALPASYAVVTGALATGDRKQLLALVFPAVGLWLLGAAMRPTARAWRYGTTMLELTTLPATIGGTLEGTIRVGRGLEPAAGVRVQLASIRRVTRLAGKSRSVSERTLWQSGPLAPEVRREAEGAAMPIAFTIPGDAVPSGDENADGTVYWRLIARSPARGVDYAATFDVPVFHPAAVEERG
jgi:hypothetical protein